MFKRIIFLLVLPLMVFGGNVTLKEGLVEAHTKVFGDSSIDPSVRKLHADLSMQNGDFTTLRGTISFNISDFTSTNSSRDEHMQEMFEMKTFPTITFHINNVVKKAKKYILEGTLAMHGVTKDIAVICSIEPHGTTFTMQSNFSVKVTDYGMEQPTLLFLTVRNRVDIDAKLTLETTK